MHLDLLIRGWTLSDVNHLLRSLSSPFAILLLRSLTNIRIVVGARSTHAKELICWRGNHLLLLLGWHLMLINIVVKPWDQGIMIHQSTFAFFLRVGVLNILGKHYVVLVLADFITQLLVRVGQWSISIAIFLVKRLVYITVPSTPHILRLYHGGASAIERLEGALSARVYVIVVVAHAIILTCWHAMTVVAVYVMTPSHVPITTSITVAPRSVIILVAEALHKALARKVIVKVTSSH